MTKARDVADLLANGTVDTDELADAIITTAKLVDGSVTTAKIPDGAITAPKLNVQGSDIPYDNTTSGISANTLQEAIDYLNVLSGGGSAGAQATYTRENFTATAGQTTFTTTNGYELGYLQVYMNGVLLATSDFTANDGSTVVLAVGASEGDEISTIALDSFAISEVLRILNISASAPDDSLTVGATGILSVSGVTTTGKVISVRTDDPLLTPYASDTFASAKFVAEESRVQIVSADNGYDGSSTILSTGDHHWQIHATGPNNNNKLRIGYVNTSSDGSLGNSLSGTSAIWIDTSGRVSMPSQPRGTLYAPAGLGALGNAIIPFPNYTDVGGGVVVSTGASAGFTVPVTGTYLATVQMGITATAAGTSIGDGIFLGLRKNGAWYVDREMFPIFNQGAVNGEENAITVAMTVRLAAGDKLTAVWDDVSTSYSSTNGGAFCIHLLS